MNEVPRIGDRQVNVAAWVAVAWTIGLLVLLAIVSEGVMRGLAFVGALAAGLGAFYQQRKLPSLSQGGKVAVVGAVLAVDLVASLSWLGGAIYQWRRAVDVTAGVTLTANTNVLPGGHHAVLDVDITATRSAIVIVFGVEDHNLNLGSCRPNTRLIVTPDTAGNRGRPTTVEPDTPLTIGLFSGARRLRLDIAVTNIRQDVNCAVDISVTSAKLTHG